MRSIQYVDCFAQENFDCTVQEFFTDDLLAEKYARGAYAVGQLVRAYVKRIYALTQLGNFDVVWIEKEALPWMPAWLERFLLRGVPYTLDYDDAVFHNYDLHPHWGVRRLFGRRVDALMAGAKLVVGGNGYLARRASSAGARWVEVLPTAIDLLRYPYSAEEGFAAKGGARPRVVWIGSPSTARYLQLLRAPLRELAARLPFTLRVIGGGEIDLPGVDVEVLPWSEATEVAAISDCDVGVMPLEDSPWERGKCGYKLIQYMACGLPVVASPVGVNSSIVREGENGFLAHAPQEWVDALERLLSDARLRVSMGRAGRRRVEDEFCLQVTAPRLASWLRKAAAP